MHIMVRPLPPLFLPLLLECHSRLKHGDPFQLKETE